jgi:hypothetical protein
MDESLGRAAVAPSYARCVEHSRPVPGPHISTPRRGQPRRGGLLEQSLAHEIAHGLLSWPGLLFVAIELAAGSFLLFRRGPGILPLLLLTAAGVAFYGLLGGLAGRHPLANSLPDPVRSPRLEGLAVGIAYAGLLGWMFGVLPIGMHLFLGGIAAWLTVVVVAGYRRRDFRWLVRTWRPFVPLFVGVTAPKLFMTGPGLLAPLAGALPSGLLQQLLLQLGLTARAEALLSRPELAALAAAFAFGVVHTPLNLPAAGGEWSIALANSLVLQTPIGLAFCLAYQRHRAPLALGAIHAIVMA